MNPLRLILSVHHHHPFGQPKSTLENSYSSRLLPFLEAMEKHTGIPFVLHLSGPLLESLSSLHPDYLDRVRRLVESGQVEILGGGMFEPVLAMIPSSDRVGQIQRFSEYLLELFGAEVRGLSLAGQAWEQSLVTSLSRAGIEYTVLSDSHFPSNIPGENGPFGYYLTESEGHFLRAFFSCPFFRDGIAYADPLQCLDFLKAVAEEHPLRTVVFADEGSRFGGWSNTSDQRGRTNWLERFCEMLLAQSDWLELTTFAGALESSLPLGRLYPTENSSAWRNGLALHPESNLMYSRMLFVSQRLAAAQSREGEGVDPDYLEVARDELYRGQCHDGYSFAQTSSGGITEPSVRNAVYQHLIAAENALDEAHEQSGPRVRAEVGDYNLDAFQEVRLENDRLIALAFPAHGGHIGALDLRESLLNVLATSTGVPLASAPGGKQSSGRHTRKAFVDHFYPVEATLSDLVAGRDVEHGDFAVGTYHARIRREPARVALLMDRSGRAGEHSIRLRKTVSISAGQSSLSVRYEIEQIPAEACLHFAVEINLAAMAVDGSAGHYADPSGANLGPLDSTLDLAHLRGISLTNPSAQLSTSLSWSQASGLWCFPIETPRRGEGGIEPVPSAIVPHWHITPDDHGSWEVTLNWSFEQREPSSDNEGAALEPAAVVAG